MREGWGKEKDKQIKNAWRKDGSRKKEKKIKNERRMNEERKEY